MKNGEYFDKEKICQPDKMPNSPSFSMMYSLPDGFCITMYCGTHKIMLNRKTLIHKDCGICIQLGENMVIIWHEGTLHSGSKSRNNANGK